MTRPANLQNPIFTDEAKAREWLEARVWPNGPVCPHCGSTGSDVRKLEGAKHRPGVYQCNACREQFTVTVKTVFERSKIPLSKWLAALFLMTASKKGVSAHQVHRSLGISYKSAWFMCHRLREAMRTGGFAPLGGGGKIVEVDETYIGRKEGMHKARGSAHKNMVLALVQRGGSARSFVMDGMAISDVMPIVRENVAKESRMNTDESNSYNDLGKEYFEHQTVNHSLKEYAWRTGDYVDGKPYIVTTNTVEGYFSIFKRGMKGVYQHCGEKHLHRYLAEFDFRYNTRTALGYNDVDRAEKLAAAISGKRLTYRRPHKIAQPRAN